ncbi:MAG: glycosyltransferase [Thermodesulfobacteriota bacterium]
MRLLLVPHTGLRNIHSDSNYLLFLDLARYLTESGHWCYMLVPGFAKEKVYRMKRLMYVFHDFIRYDYYTAYNLIDEDWLIKTFSRRYGSEIIDAIITSKASVVPQWQAILSDYVRCRDIECCIIEPGVFDRESGGALRGDIGLALMSLGYSQATTVFLTEYERERAKKLASEYVSAARIKKIHEQAVVRSVGIDTEYIDKKTEGITRAKKFTLIYAARLNSVKKPDRILELYDTMYRSGRNVNIVVTTGTQQLPVKRRMDKILKGRPEIVVHYGCPKDDYLKIAKSAHAFVCWSESEGFPVGYYEQMYLGAVGIFPKKKWALKQLPPEYKWMFSRKEEAYSMLMEIYDHYDKISQEMDWMKEFIAKSYGYREVYSILEKAVSGRLKLKNSYIRPNGIRQLLDTIVPSLPDEFSLDLVIRSLGKYGRCFLEDRYARGGTFRYPSDYDIHRMLTDEYGCIDLCNRNRPVYRKGDIYGKKG